MALMQWDETMSVGVEKMDAQHRGLINLINEAYEVMQRHDEHRMSELIDKMRGYANMHFSEEEALMREHGYPEFEAHKFQHAKFNNEVAEFKRKQFEKTNLSQIFVFLSRWLTTHIMDEDRKYTPFMPEEEDATRQGDPA